MLLDNCNSARRFLSCCMHIDSLYKHLQQFLLEPFFEHEEKEERYLAIYTELEHDVILFHNEGGVNIGDIDEKGSLVRIPLNRTVKEEEIQHALLLGVPKRQKSCEGESSRFRSCCQLRLKRPAALPSKVGRRCCLDQEAWEGPMEQEKTISDIDRVSIANLKLTLLNKKGRIWTAISGGGISLLLGDTMKEWDLDELACYSQFSGPVPAPEIYEFFKAILELMLQEKSENGKVLFTGSQALDVVTMIKLKKMQGRVLDEYKERLREANISIIIRSTVGVVSSKNDKVPDELFNFGIPIYIFGGDVPVKELVHFALRQKTVPLNVPLICRTMDIPSNSGRVSLPKLNSPEELLFTRETMIVAVGMIPPAIQGILDYDFICQKKRHMIAAIVRPGCKHQEEQYSWGSGKVSIPVFHDVDRALDSHPEASVVANAAPGPYAYKVAWMALQKPQVRAMILMVGEIPIQQIRELILLARQKNVMIIGPTVPKHRLQVNVLKPGVFRCNLLGDIGGPMLDVVDLKLYRPGSVVMLSKSGGLSTELCVAIARNSDGLYLCLSLGGGRFTGSGFMDHIKYLHDNPAVSMFLLIGEVGGQDEYEVCDAIRNGSITKPVIAYCIGASVSHFQDQPAFFGHTGGGIDLEKEDASVKNQALKDAGALVPDCFDGIADKIGYELSSLKTRPTPRAAI
ncbi:putative ATP-citrate synthase [Apostichopus japonicus]|uniref:ATP citrate synthase n=1 Tax=Stichopus japonicus TaxID=307972 RepID=A0A2G8KZQ4_STIJA|nr:putative ATP-citrate synthase [Apostichopus japonicus]